MRSIRQVNHKGIQVLLGMEDLLEERALYEAIDRIRQIRIKRPHEENILKAASKTGGLATEHFRKNLSSLVNKGTIYVSKATFTLYRTNFDQI